MPTRRRFLTVPPALAASAFARGPGAEAFSAAQSCPAPADGGWLKPPYDTYVKNTLVAENAFVKMEPDRRPLPSYDEAQPLLPEPFWDGHAEVIDCYQAAWRLAFCHLQSPAAGSGFVARFIDTAFNDCTFLWDSCLMTMFGRYGARAFEFQRTLDNFYAKQHPDGFICRQLGREKGDDRFNRFEPDSTGPNVLAWAEWEHYSNFGDRERLARVFPVLRAYHQWLRAYRTWQDGSYWSSGWGCGMDNQPRLPKEAPYASPEHYHGRMSWVDVTLQQILSARLLVRIGRELGAEGAVADMASEVERLTRFVNDHLWSAASRFYCDRFDDGRLNGVKTIGAYWALLAGVVPKKRLGRFLAHLEDPKAFKRPHRVPSLSADTPGYKPEGDYWRGGVWPPTNYLLLRGLTLLGRDPLAHEIARNHLDNVLSVFQQTGTLHENYAPETAAPGQPARRDFVGWSALPPVAVLLEYVFGLRPDAPARRLVWDLRLLEAHGVGRYPFGPATSVDLRCEARLSADERPRIRAQASAPLELEVRWAGRSEILRLGAS